MSRANSVVHAAVLVAPRAYFPAPLQPAMLGPHVWDRGKLPRSHRFAAQRGHFHPPDTRGTLLSPGYIGGVNWGGMVFDEQRERVIAAVNHLPMVVTLISPQDFERDARSDRFPHSEFARQAGTPYAMRREPLLSPWDLPCTAPPWGTLVSVDLRRSRIVWQVAARLHRRAHALVRASRDFGMPNMADDCDRRRPGVCRTTMDSYLRAFDIETGRELWRYKLPAGGQATPMTYRRDATSVNISSSAPAPRPARTPRGELRHRLRAAIRSGGAPIDLRR